MKIIINFFIIVSILIQTNLLAKKNFKVKKKVNKKIKRKNIYIQKTKINNKSSITIPIKDDYHQYQVIFELKNEKNIFLELLIILEKILIEKPIESLLFLNILLKKYSDKKKIIQILLKYEKLFEILFNNEENNINQEIQQLSEFLLEKPIMNDFLKNNHISNKFFEKFLKLIIISKNILLQSLYKEGAFATNYDLNSLNINKLFTSRKLFYIFILDENQYNSLNFKNLRSVISLKSKSIIPMIESIKNISGNHYIIEKNSPEFDFLKTKEMYCKKLFINGKIHYKIAICYETIEERINNMNFSFIEINFKSSISEEGIHTILKELNKIKSNEILMIINRIFNNKNLQLVDYKTHNDNPIDSIMNQPEILDIVLNFPQKKYLLIPQEDHYILYLIFNVINQKESLQNLKNSKEILKYVYKNLENY